MHHSFTPSRRALLGAALGLPLWARPGKITITGLELIQLNGHWQAPPKDHQYQVNPSHVYDRYLLAPRDRRGVEGVYGPIDKKVVDQQLRAFIIGRDPLAGRRPFGAQDLASNWIQRRSRNGWC